MWFAIGTMFWALFVVGHDCGHRSFSNSLFICDLFGHLSHAPILVPFHPWRLSHQKHHKNTGNVRTDETFVAVPERLYRKMYSIFKVVRYFTYPILGYTLYLIGGNRMPVRFYSHFFPKGEIYNTPEKQKQSALSVFLVFVMLYFLRNLYVAYGWNFVWTYYFAPYMVFVGWLAIVTHLHHTHPDVPWYRGSDWTFDKGALSTVDRDYGIFEDIHHNIGTHIIHHVCSKIPHYHLIEATKKVIPVLGTNYKKSSYTTWGAMKMIFNYCRFVPNSGGVLYYEQNWREILQSPMKPYTPHHS